MFDYDDLFDYAYSQYEEYEKYFNKQNEADLGFETDYDYDVRKKYYKHNKDITLKRRSRSKNIKKFNKRRRKNKYGTFKTDSKHRI